MGPAGGGPPPPPAAPAGGPPPPPPAAPADAPPPPAPAAPADAPPPPAPAAPADVPPPPAPAGGVAPPDPSKLTQRGAPEEKKEEPPKAADPPAPAEPEKPKPSAIKKSVAARSISSNVATLRGHKKSAEAPKAAEGNGGVEYPVLEIYNVGVYTYDSSNKTWETSDQNVYYRLFVVHNPTSRKYRLLAIKQNEEAFVGLNTPIPGNMVVARQGRFLQFRDKKNIYLLAFTSKDDSAIFEGIVFEIKKETGS